MSWGSWGWCGWSSSRTTATRRQSLAWRPDSVMTQRPSRSFARRGCRPSIITAEPGAATVEALRLTLHRLLVEEQVPPFRIAVLSGVSAGSSDVLRRRRYGNTVLWNEAIDDEGRSKGLPPEAVPEEPDDVVLFETIRRFKGLEREVIVLCELPEEGGRLDELLYVGLTRATTHVVVIAPSGLAERLRGS